MNISHHHAHIFYDLTRRCFALEVIKKNGYLVEGIVHLPRNLLVKFDSQDPLQIGDKEFYFVLRIRITLGGSIEPRHYAMAVGGGVARVAVDGGVGMGKGADGAEDEGGLKRSSGLLSVVGVSEWAFLNLRLAARRLELAAAILLGDLDCLEETCSGGGGGRRDLKAGFECSTKGLNLKSRGGLNHLYGIEGWV
ncbi:putative SMAD/FHA domain-containing protein [Rosa chinensis]|uniref:Putative SMAD/FHA domain-containing protein n=1 Tax=Rosa chinensis TaxID=74649 RepID=A0A2P6PJC1_ROSCH|nr:putative SMAD/FHA domain-containing protein [Rosa chinensis]